MLKSIREEPLGVQKESGAAPVRYAKHQLMGAARYRDRQDVLSAVLMDGKEYSLKEAEKAIDRFMKGKVR